MNKCWKQIPFLCLTNVCLIAHLFIEVYGSSYNSFPFIHTSFLETWFLCWANPKFKIKTKFKYSEDQISILVLYRFVGMLSRFRSPCPWTATKSILWLGSRSECGNKSVKVLKTREHKLQEAWPIEDRPTLINEKVLKQKHQNLRGTSEIKPVRGEGILVLC